jgi:type IV fimbrial biogenesis protein FimT
MPQTSTRRTSRGFTLLELLMVVAIGAIVLAIGIPSFMDLIARNRVTTQVNELIANLQVARSEAVKRRVRVTLCPDSSGDAENPDCLEQDEWHTGYILFADEDGDGEPAAAELLRIVEGSENAPVTITGNHNGNQITFDAEGASRGNPGTFTVCDGSERAPAKAVIVSRTGRPRVSDTDGEGNALVCPEP